MVKNSKKNSLSLFEEELKHFFSKNKYANFWNEYYKNDDSEIKKEEKEEKEENKMVTISTSTVVELKLSVEDSIKISDLFKYVRTSPKTFQKYGTN